MRSIQIRELSSTVFEEAAERNESLAITYDHVVCGVLIPVSSQWVEDVVHDSLSRIVRSVQVGEAEIDSGRPFVTLDDALVERSADSFTPPLRRVPIREVSGKLIKEAAERNESLAITSDRLLRGVLIPISERWLHEIVDYNLSRIVRSIQVGEREITGSAPLVTLDDVTADDQVGAYDVGDYDVGAYDGGGDGERECPPERTLSASS